MNDSATILIPLLVGLALGLGAGVYTGLLAARRLRRQASEEAARLLDETQQDADNRRRATMLELDKLREASSQEADRRERELDEREAGLETRERDGDRQANSLKTEQARIERRLQQLEQDEREAREGQRVAAEQLDEARASRERVAGLSAAQAREEVIAEAREAARQEAARAARRIEDEAREQAEREAMRIVVASMQQLPLREAIETTVSFIQLSSDEMKGRIIGREGRNIRALEMATGIDLIVDDTPSAILISSFDPVRREIARLSIERLIEDGRIHPARIEEVVDKVREEFAAHVEEQGTQAALSLGISELHPRLARLVGRMRYRAAHGHNLLQHSLEVALISGYMAEAVGADVALCHQAGLLHQIARVADQPAGHPANSSAEIAGKYGQPAPVVGTIQALHPDVTPSTMEAHLVGLASRLSANRPGARKDNLEIFVERLTRLEALAGEFEGVRRALAVKAGKELRVLVDAARVSDSEAHELSKRVARRVERELIYPGQVRISVVREVRSVQFAV